MKTFLKKVFHNEFLAIVGIVLGISFMMALMPQSEPQKKEPVKTEQVKRDTTISKRQIELEQRIIKKQMEIKNMKLDSLVKKAKTKSEGGGR